MGPDRRAENALNGTVRIVPDVPSFAVDDGFAYAVPDGWSLSVGDLVRVPLGGRRVRGWVVGRDTGQGGRRRLRNVLSRSGDVPVFDEPLLGVLRWAAAHYVAPLATLLAKATPPNLPRLTGSRPDAVALSTQGPEGRGVEVWIGSPSWGDRVGDRVEAPLAAGHSVIVVAPTWVELEELNAALTRRFGSRVVVASTHLPPAEVTTAWVAAATRPARVVVGTREAAWWRVPSLGLAVVTGEGRRGLKDGSTPTVNARDILLKRAAVERSPVVLCDVVPTPESLARAATVSRPGGARPWGLVDVVDRRDDPPGGPLFTSVASTALRAAVAAGKSVLVFTHRRRSAQRCVRCRTLRRCRSCGAAPGSGSTCDRCGTATEACTSCGGRRFEPLGAAVGRLVTEVSRLLGSAAVGEAGSGRAVVVGTERDLPGLAVDLAIVVDADALLLAPTFRAGEQGLRLLARVVAAAGTGRGRRAVVQTMQPGHPALEALRRRDPIAFVQADGERRARQGLPPGGELLIVEATGLADGTEGELAETVGSRASVYGPEVSGDRLRWLIGGRDLTSARVVLRDVVARWREGGARVRVDADPIDA